MGGNVPYFKKLREGNEKKKKKTEDKEMGVRKGDEKDKESKSSKTKSPGVGDESALGFDNKLPIELVVATTAR